MFVCADVRANVRNGCESECAFVNRARESHFPSEGKSEDGKIEVEPVFF